MQYAEATSANQLDFVAVGPFKTGTSWIYNYLSDYRQVALPTVVKETFFFDSKFDKGLDWYYSHFTKSRNIRKVGEVAPSYFHSTEACSHIYQTNPNCKILVTLREPVSRLVSFYLHMKQRGELKQQTSFLEALERVNILKDTALYYQHLTRWIDVFGADFVEVIFFEELVKSPENFSQILCSHLNLDIEDTKQDLSQKVNSSQSSVNHTLAKVVYSSVNLLHELGLHKLVDYGKSLGVKQLLSKKGEKFQLTDEEFVAAFNLIEDDILKLETVLNLDLTEWREIWQARGIGLKQTS